MRVSSDGTPGGAARGYGSSQAPVGARAEIRDSFVERVRRTRKRLRTTVRSPGPSGPER
jgi:hypothetical protein